MNIDFFLNLINVDIHIFSLLFINKQSHRGKKSKGKMNPTLLATRSPYALSDDVIASKIEQLINENYAGDEETFRKEMPSIEEMRKFYLSGLRNARTTLSFAQPKLKLRMVSNLASHERSPFVHVWTSLPGQGVGPMDIAFAEKELFEEERFSKSDPSEYFSKTEHEREVDAFIKDMETSSPWIVDGTVQVPIGEFERHNGFNVSGFSDLSLYFPKGDPISSYGEKNEKEKDIGDYIDVDTHHFSSCFSFEPAYPADATIRFQVHSTIKNSEGKDTHISTGMGSIPLADVAKRVQVYLGGDESVREANGDMKPLDIPIILNSVSSQDPRAKLIADEDQVEVDETDGTKRGGIVPPEKVGAALCTGSIFLYVNVKDEATVDFFNNTCMFYGASKHDITDGNFTEISTTNKVGVLHDMAPFIPQYTKSFIAEGLEKDGGWEFKSTLPETKTIHAPYYKCVQTTSGFMYYHDRAMQRPPSPEFIINSTYIVLQRHGWKPEAFIHAVSNPVTISSASGNYKINPAYIKALKITADTITAYPTSMPYRGDTADLNTDYKNIIANRRTESDAGTKLLTGDLSDKYTYFGMLSAEHHSMVQAIGKSGVPAANHGKFDYWDPQKNIGTEIFGDIGIDRSGDCEDFDKMIARIVCGIKSSNCSHPLIQAHQNILSRYTAFSVLSSVTSRNVKEAHSKNETLSLSKKDKSDLKSKGITSDGLTRDGDIVIGSKRDIESGIGAHMWGILIPNEYVLTCIQKYSSSLATLPDGSILPEDIQRHIAEEVLHRPIVDSEGKATFTVRYPTVPVKKTLKKAANEASKAAKTTSRKTKEAVKTTSRKTKETAQNLKRRLRKKGETYAPLSKDEYRAVLKKRSNMEYALMTLTLRAQRTEKDKDVKKAENQFYKLLKFDQRHGLSPHDWAQNYKGSVWPTQVPELTDYIDKRIARPDKWEEYVVPHGFYYTGMDIPEEGLSFIEASDEKGDIMHPSFLPLHPHVVDEAESYLRKKDPVLVLEGTGLADSMILAHEYYMDELEDKIEAENDVLLEIEGSIRLISASPAGQATAESIRENQSVFSKVSMKLDNLRLVNPEWHVRVSQFYRMPSELYVNLASRTDSIVVPNILSKYYTREQRKQTKRITGPPSHDIEGKEPIDQFTLNRTIPVELYSLDRHGKKTEEKKEEDPTYGIHISDLVQRKENIAFIKGVDTTKNEKRVARDVVRHLPPSIFLRIADSDKEENAEKLVARYDSILKQTMEKNNVLSRGFFGHIKKKNMYARLEDMNEEDMRKMGKYFGSNGFVRAVEANLEPFSNEHFQIRITVDIDVSGTKQLKLESNTLAENLSRFDPDKGKDNESEKDVAAFIDEDLFDPSSVYMINPPEELLVCADKDQVHEFLVNTLADIMQEMPM